MCHSRGDENPHSIQAIGLSRKKKFHLHSIRFFRSRWRRPYRDKLARELRSRLDAWAWYLDDCKKEGESAIVHYPHQVETRVKADLLLDQAAEMGMDVEKSQARQATLDQRLGAVFSVGEFCWLEELAPGFAPDRFWFLYGFPRQK